MSTADIINDLADDVFLNAKNHGFHEDDHLRSDVANLAIWTANLHGETSELWEAARKGQLREPCDKDECVVPECGTVRTIWCVEEELADIVIRALDTARALGLDIGEAVMAKHEYNKGRPHKHGGKLA